MPQENLINRFIACLDELRQIDLMAIARLLLGASHIFTAGNGGSAATASHFVADLVRVGLRATCLSDNISAVTAFANDISYDQVYSRQLDIIHPQDVLVVLSVSGETTNLIKAVTLANSKGASTIALVGSGGGVLAKIAKQNLILSSDKFGEVEGIHSCICHIIPILIQEVEGEKR